MAKNCLVTRLKGVVNNDNLPYFGGIRLKAAFNIDYADSYFSVEFAEGVNVEDINTRWLNGSSQPIEKNTWNRKIYVHTTNAIDDTLLVDQKYEIIGIDCKWGNGMVFMDDLSGLSGLKSIQFGLGNDEGDISKIPYNAPLERITFGLLDGNISHLNNYVNLETIDCSFYKSGFSTKISGDLSSLPSLTKLINFVVPKNVQGYLSSLNCVDTLKTFANETNNGNVDSDASLWANRFTVLQNLASWNTRLTWNSPTLRSSAYPLINAQCGFATSTDCDNYIINMAACLDNGLYEGSNKNFYLQNSTRTSASDAAVAKFEAAGWTFNGVTKV